MLLERAPYPSQSSSCTAAVYVNQAQEMFHHFRGGRQKKESERERERERNKGKAVATTQCEQD